MKFRNKIFALFLSCFIFFSSVISSFANPVAVSLSYEALMGILALVGTVGITINNQQEYNNLVDELLDNNIKDYLGDDYLSNLEELVWHEYINRNNGNDNGNDNNDNEDRNIQVPFLPSMDKVLNNLVGNLSQDYEYRSCTKLPYAYLGDSMEEKYKKGKKIIVRDNVVYTFYCTTEKGERVAPSFKFIKGDNNVYTLWYHSDIYNPKSSWSDTPYSFYQGDSVAIVQSGGSVLCLPGSWVAVNLNHDLATAEKFNHKGTPYVPLKPSITDNKININPSSIPNIKDGIDLTAGGKLEVLAPKPLPTPSPGDKPGVDTGGSEDSSPSPSPSPSPGPGDDTNNSSLTDYISSLVVPGDSYWIDKFNHYKQLLTSKYPNINISELEKVCVGETPFPNIDISIMGVKVSRILDSDSTINATVNFFRPLLQGFVGIFLMLYVYKEVYFMIRGVYPFSAGTNNGGVIK